MNTITKYAAFARIAATQALRDRAELYGRLVFLVVILGVFSALWRAVREAGLPLGADPASLVWYLAATEWILLSPIAVHVDIEGDIRRGDVAYQLTRPFSYVASLAAQCAGALAVRAPAFAVVAFASAWAFTRTLPLPAHVALVVPFALAAMAVIEGLYILTGLAAFWLGDVSPLFWVWQKLLFTLGGLMLPLALYPAWMQRVAGWTPFPSLLSGPAGFLLGAHPADAWLLAARIVGWGVVVAVAIEFVSRRALRALQLNGG